MKKPNQFINHCFRKEYGKMVSVITTYLGFEQVHTAEDIVQETLYKVLPHWTFNGIPKNLGGWWYIAAKPLALNTVNRSKNPESIKSKIEQEKQVAHPVDNIVFFNETKEVTSGYYHILAKDLNEVITIAKNDPRFEDGDWKIEVRPIMKVAGIN